MERCPKCGYVERRLPEPGTPEHDRMVADLADLIMRASAAAVVRDQLTAVSYKEGIEP